jgi:hypothetical protein
VLYDDERDPYQMRNLAADPGSRPLLAEMERRVKTWMERTGDSWSNDWTYPVEDNGRLYRNGAYYSVNEYLKTL